MKLSPDLEECLAGSLVGLVGLLTCLAVRRKLGWAVVPLGGLYVILIECRPYWMECSVRHLLRAYGWLDPVVGNPAWYTTWRFVPVLLVAVFSASFAAAVRKGCPPSPGCRL